MFTTSKETFTHYQPPDNSDPAHIATAPGGLNAKTPAMTPLILDASTRKLVARDGITDGTTVDTLAAATNQTSTTLTFYKSDMFRCEDVLRPEAASDETKKQTAFTGTAISIVQLYPSSLKAARAALSTGLFYVDAHNRPAAGGK